MTDADIKKSISGKPIFALATPLGGAIAIMRVSGSDIKRVLSDIFTGTISHSKLTHGFIKDGSNVIDDAMAVFFEAPRSYTGEDMFELHIHASPAIADEVSRLLIDRGLSPAAPGEFTKRAFLNGKIDLIRAEAVMDIINANAKRSAASALRQLSGELSKTLERIETLIVDAAAAIEAVIDYPDEMETEYELSIRENLNAALLDINTLIESGKLSKHVREGIRLSIVGKPNSGKSSIMNLLSGEDCSIVSDTEGTTRDIIERDVTLNSVPVKLSDTAGIRESADSVEAMGVKRTYASLKTSDMALVVLDGSRPFDYQDEHVMDITREAERIIAVNKCDLDMRLDKAMLPDDEPVLYISAVTGQGISELKSSIASKTAPGDEGGLITNARHIKLLESAAQALQSALSSMEWDCAATDIREALRSIGAINGRDVDEALLDRIFSRFCLGK